MTQRVGRVGAPVPARIAALTVLAVAAIVRIPALGAGFVLDDFAHMAMATGRFPLARAPWNLFAFVRSEADVVQGVASGALPWWTDRDLRLSFFRPLSSLLATFDARVLGPNDGAQHVHSLLWVLALVMAAALLFRRLLAPRAALFAALVYAVEEAITTPLAWVANRSALVSSTFAVLALVAWTDRRRSRTAAILCELATALAILGGEYGLGVLFMRATLSLVERDVPMPKRLRSAAAMAGVFVAYAIAHRALGFRAAAFALYRDPMTDPAAYVAWSAEQIQRLLQDLVIGLPTVIPPTLGTTMVTLAALVTLAWFARSRSAVALVVGGLLALVPLASSIANTRLLVLPALGMSAVVGSAIDVGLGNAFERHRHVALRSLGALAMLAVAWIHLPQAAFRSWVEGGAGSSQNHRRLEAILEVPVAPTDHVVVVSAGDPTTILYFREVRAIYERSVPADFRVLTASATGERVFRTDDRTLEVEMPRSGLLANPMASLMRDPSKPLALDVPVEAGSMTVTPLVGGGKPGPSRVRFRFDRSLDDPTIKFLLSRPTGFEAFAMPAIGGQVGVPPGADPSLASGVTPR